MSHYLTSKNSTFPEEDFIRNLTYVGKNSDVDDISGHLNQIKLIDKRCEKGQKYAAISCFFSIILGIVLANCLPAQAGIILMLCVIITIGLFMASAEHARLNVDDERYLLAQKLLEMLKRDLSPKAEFTVEADFRRLNIISNFLRHVAGGKLYALKWLTLRGEFIDGTDFQFTVTEYLKVKNRKMKQRHKGYRLDLVLRLSDPKYAGVKNVLENLIVNDSQGPFDQSSFQLFKLPAGAVPKRLEFRGRRLMLSVKAPSKPFFVTPDKTVNELYNITTSMFLTAYHLLNLSRKISSASQTSA